MIKGTGSAQQTIEDRPMRLTHLRLRFGLTGLLAACVTGAGVWAGTVDEPADEPESPHPPMTISASCVGRFRKGRSSWYLSVNSAGQAEITVKTRGKPTRRQFVVPEKEMTKLWNVVEAERFVDLADQYGSHVPDDSTSTITVTVGDRTKTVRLCYLPNWMRGKDAIKLGELSRAVHVFLIVREWFNEPEAVDQRTYLKAVLDALKK
jgi:hypothetical protein